MRKDEEEDILNYFEERQLLDYGNTIESYHFEYILQMDFEDNIRYLGKLFDIKELFEENGYLCTTTGCKPGELRIYDAAEQSVRIEKRFNNFYKKLRRLNKCLCETKTKDFSEKEFKCHLFTKSKIQAIQRSLDSLLKDL